jgi:hypothetical protein
MQLLGGRPEMNVKSHTVVLLVRDSQDQFIGDLHRQSWWASLAAIAAALSAGLQN